MIAVDIDGTLLPGVGRAVSQRNCAALKAAQAAEIQVVIATGRRQDYAMPILEPICLSDETAIISSNGTVTRNFAGKHISRNVLEPHTARALCSLLRKFGTAVFTFDHEGPGALVLESIETLSSRIALWVKANENNLKVVRPLERAFEKGEAPIQGMIAGTMQEMDEAEALIRESPIAEEVELHRTEYPERDLCIIDLLPPGISKGWALKRLTAQLGVSMDEVMAIGDNYNDLEMLESVGYPVLMGNAPEELRELGMLKGWTIAPRNDEDGVAVIVESVVINTSGAEADQQGMVEFS